MLEHSSSTLTIVRIRELQRVADGTAGEVRAARDVVANAVKLLTELGDQSAADSLTTIAAQLGRPTVSTVVAGENGSGKSALINGLLGTRLLPADVLSTSTVPVTVAWGPAPTATALVIDEHDAVKAIPTGFSELDRLLTTFGATANGLVVDSVRIEIPHPLLATGLELTDTPGVSGGLASPSAAPILGLISTADALLFVTDASQELSFPELEFLQVACAVGDLPLTVAETRIDCYPTWTRIVELDRGHLDIGGIEATIVPVSPTLRQAAQRLDDAQIDQESGLPLLAWYLGTTIVAAALQRQINDALIQVQAHVGAASAQLQSRRVALDSARQSERIEADLQTSEQRLRRLETQWADAFTHALGSFRTEAARGLDDRLRDAARELLAAIDDTDPSATWPAIETRVHRATNAAVGDYLRATAQQAEDVIRSMANFLDVDRSELEVDLSGFQSRPMPISAEIDRPEFSQRSRGRLFEVGRASMSTGLMSGGATLAFLGPLAPVVGLVAAGATASMMLQRTKSTDIEGQRREAKQSVQGYLTELSRQVSRSVEAQHADALFELRSAMKAQMESLHGRTVRHLEQLRLDRLSGNEQTDARRIELDHQIESCSVVLSHARRIEHRLARPDLVISKADALV